MRGFDWTLDLSDAFMIRENLPENSKQEASELWERPDGSKEMSKRHTYHNRMLRNRLGDVSTNTKTYMPLSPKTAEYKKLLIRPALSMYVSMQQPEVVNARL